MIHHVCPWSPLSSENLTPHLLVEGFWSWDIPFPPASADCIKVDIWLKLNELNTFLVIGNWKKTFSAVCALATRDMQGCLNWGERHREQAHGRNYIVRQRAGGRETETETDERFPKLSNSWFQDSETLTYISCHWDILYLPINLLPLFFFLFFLGVFTTASVTWDKHFSTATTMYKSQ